MNGLHQVLGRSEARSVRQGYPDGNWPAGWRMLPELYLIKKFEHCNDSFSSGCQQFRHHLMSGMGEHVA